MTEVLTVTVPSESDPTLSYVLHARGEDITCSCRGFNSHRHCKHQDALRRVIREDQMPEDTDTAATTAVAKRDLPPAEIVVGTPGTALLPSRAEMTLMTDIAKTVFAAGGGMLPAHIKSPYQALAIMIAGHELGLRPMTSLRHIYIVNGKTELETRAMVGIVKARDERIKFSWPEYTQEAVTCIVERPGQDPVKVRYTVEDATKSGQMKKGGPWQSYTRDMLYAAATKRAVRLAAPDIINAIDSGMTHAVIEADAQDVTPDRDLLKAAVAGMSELPADAYNEGDDPGSPPGGEGGGISAEQEAAASPSEPEPPAFIRLGRWLRQQRDQLDPTDFAELVKGINTRYPNALTQNGDTVLSGKGKLSDRQAQAILVELDRSPAEAPTIADAGEQGTSQFAR